MKDSKKIIAIKKLLEQQGDKPESIAATLEVIRANESSEKVESLRSWVALIISGIALIISIYVAFKK